eukprot:g37139.t1
MLESEITECGAGGVQQARRHQRSRKVDVLGQDPSSEMGEGEGSSEIERRGGAGEGRWDGDRVQVLYKEFSEPLLGLNGIEEATSGAVDALDHIDGCASEPLSDVKGLFGALNGDLEQQPQSLWTICRAGIFMSNTYIQESVKLKVLI